MTSGHRGFVTRWVSRLRIRARLILAFAVLLGLLLMLAALSISWQQQLARALTELIDQQALTRETLYDISSNAEDAARKLLVLMSRERATRVSAYTEIDAANRQLDAAMLLLKATSPPGPRREALLVVEQRLQRYRTSYGEVIDMIEAEHFDGAREVMSAQTEGALSLLIGAIQSLSGVSEAEMQEQARGLRDRGRRDRDIAIGLSLLGILLGGLLALGVTRSIVRPLNRVSAGARQIARGEYALNIELLADDELGHMSSTMNALAGAVSEREQRLMRLADTDMLTGLAQRGRFIAEGDALLARLRGGAQSAELAELAEVAEAAEVAALLCIDVDRLKAVNGLLGFDAGDALLKGAAAKLAGHFDGVGACGRLAGGTFVALVPLARADQATALAAQLREQVEHQLSWQGQALDLSVSMGIAHWPEHADATETLLRRAEQAMFEAKRQREHVSIYNPLLEASRLLHLSLLSDLQAAVSDDQLRQFLQPKINLRSGEIEGAEALVRWQHPQRGWLPPSEFVPFAESSGRIRLVTHWMLARAVRTLADWQRAGSERYIAVNISTLDVQDQSLPQRVAALLAEHGVAPARLQLEVTETGLMASGADPIAVLHALREQGVRLAIDDFGTGQSSLGYLQRLPVDELKVDRSFVDGVDREPKRQALLNAIVGIGHSLGLTVTAEGVENEAELAVVRASGCDLVQGYLIAKPLDLGAFEAWLRARG